MMQAEIYAVVNNGVVANLISWNGDSSVWSPPAGSVAIQIPSGESVDIGWTYSNGSFAKPA